MKIVTCNKTGKTFEFICYSNFIYVATEYFHTSENNSNHYHVGVSNVAFVTWMQQHLRLTPLYPWGPGVCNINSAFGQSRDRKQKMTSELAQMKNATMGALCGCRRICVILETFLRNLIQQLGEIFFELLLYC